MDQQGWQGTTLNYLTAIVEAHLDEVVPDEPPEPEPAPPAEKGAKRVAAKAASEDNVAKKTATP